MANLQVFNTYIHGVSDTYSIQVHVFRWSISATKDALWIL